MSNTQIAMRDAFGQALLNQADTFPNMVVLDADVSCSTKTVHFGKAHPERFYNMGVAEASMMDVAGGMATCGLRPVVNSFAIFLSLKCAEQIRSTICYNNLPVIIAGTYAGVSDSFDGGSHQSLADIAVMRAMPNLTVVVPGCPGEVEQALEEALHRDGPTYLRLSRNPTPVLFSDTEALKTGQIRTIQQGSDITIAVCGIPTYIAVEAARKLKEQNISAELLEISTIKPLDAETLLQSVAKTGKIVTIEEHNIHGGMGSAVAECLGKNHPVKIDMIGIDDTFTETGPYGDLLNQYGISVENITNRAKMLSA